MRDLNYSGLRREPFRQGVETLPHQGRRGSSSYLRGWFMPKGVIPTCKLTQTGAQAITTATWTKLTLDATLWDNSDPLMADLANDQIVIRHASIYLVIGLLRFAASGAGAGRFAAIVHNAVRVSEVSIPFAAAHISRGLVPAVINCVRGDTIQLHGFQDTGVNLNTDVTDPDPSLVVVAQAPPI